VKPHAATDSGPTRFAKVLVAEEFPVDADGTIVIPVTSSDPPDIPSQSRPSSPIADGVRTALQFADAGGPLPGTGRGNLHTASPQRQEILGVEATCSLILSSGLFDPVYYRRQAQLDELAPERLVLHYIQHGAAAGLDPNPLFDTDWYVQKNPHVAGTGMNPFAYYLVHGAFHTNPHMLFDLDYYRQQNSSFMESFKNPLLHYYTEGWFAGQDPHPLFSIREYLDSNPDVRAAVCEPLSHYISTGWREGRNPSRYFDTAFYLENSSDVANAGINPFAHYLQYGFREGRNPSPEFENAWYLSQLDPAEVNRDLNPLVHYRLWGEGRGISPKPRNFALTADFSLSLEDFEIWARRLAAIRNRRTRPLELSELALTLVWSDGEGIDRQFNKGCLVDEAVSVPVPIRSTTWTAWRRMERQQRTEPPGEPTETGGGARETYLFLEQSDRIDARFVAAVLEPLTRGARIVLFDLVYEAGGRAFPLLQPGANRAHIETTDAIFSRFLIAADLLTAVLDKGPTATAYEVLRRAMEELRGSGAVHAVAHVAVPFLHVPDLSKEIARQRKALVCRAAATSPAVTACREFTCSVVICTKERGHLLMQLLDGLQRFPADIVVDVAVVVNRPTNEFALACHAALRADRRVTVIDYDQPFNFSVQSNIGARIGRGELLLFLNDDIVPIGTAWLPRLAQTFADDRVAVAGPLLLYPDERIQHAGMYLGFNNCAGHTLRRAHPFADDYVFMASAQRHVAAVTGAVLLTRRNVFEQLNGFDCQLGTYLQDVDYCLRALNLDMDIVYEPTATMLHMESLSMKNLDEAGELISQRTLEHRHFMRRWGSALRSDPYHNPNFELADERLLTLAVPSWE
jgi:GT2 family glycosyltransferase